MIAEYVLLSAILVKVLLIIVRNVLILNLFHLNVSGENHMRFNILINAILSVVHV